MSMSTADRAYERFKNEVTAYEALIPQMNEMSLDVEQEFSHKQSLIQQHAEDNKLKLNELINQEIKLKEELDLLKEKEKETRARLEQRMESLEQQKHVFQELANKKQELVQDKEQLESRIEQLNLSIKERKLKLDKSNDNIMIQLSKNSVELAKYEAYTGLRINPKSPESMSFKFFNLDPNDYDREFIVDLDISGTNYEITNTEPHLEDDKVKELETMLNESKQLGKFLKNIRNEFKGFIAY